MKAIKYIAMVSFIITLLCIVLDVEIAEYIEVISQDEVLSEITQNSDFFNASVIGVQYVTDGSIWSEIQDVNGDRKSDMLLISLFDPRCLKDNANYTMDFHAAFIACTPRILSRLSIGRLRMVIPMKMYVFNRDQSDVINHSYRVRDLSLAGQAKILIRSFIVLLLMYGIFKLAMRCIAYVKNQMFLKGQT